MKDFRILAAIVLLALAGQSSGAQKLAPVILNSFGGADGSTPESTLVEGSDSNFYGTTFTGGTSNTGTVFQITPAGTLTTLHHFNGADGAHPTAGLVGTNGNFYGTTFSGGTNDDGTVFQISSAGTLTTLFQFSGTDGANPLAGVIQGTDGNFYGTTLSGGTSNTGTVFQITAGGTLITLHHFNGADGAHPTGALVQGTNGDFYGTTSSGGTNNDGTVFQISSAGTLTTLYKFSGRTNGANPQAGLVLGSDGNFYGTTFSGGTRNDGTAFKISPLGALTTLVQFSGADGAHLRGGLVEGPDGFFYGMTTGGGERDLGTVFRTDSHDVLSRLYSFTGGIDGAFPYAGLILGNDGNFYGTTAFGGQNLHGVVFRIKAFPSGIYSGLAIETNAPSHASSGFISLVLDNTGSFVAKLTIGGVRSTFKGQFDALDSATNTIPRKNLSPLQTVLHLNEVGGTNQVIGTVSDGVFTSELLADLAGAFSTRTNLCPFTGQYTFVLAPADTNDTSVPQGYGYSTLTVTKTGSGRLQGVLGDGTKIKSIVPVSAIGTWPLYNALYKNHGSCLGWISLSTNNAIDSTVDWFKPPVATDHFYPAGFTTALISTGALYVSPTAGGPSVAGSGTLTLGGGNLTSNIVKSVVISSNGTAVVSPPGNDNLALQITPKTGQFSGSFREPTINKTFNFSGLLLQITNSGAGYFLGTNRSGFVTIEIP